MNMNENCNTTLSKEKYKKIYGDESHTETNEELFMAGKIELLYERNKMLMFHIINKFQNVNIEEDDLIGSCNIAFAKAVKNYNPDKSKWATFFSKIMINEILQEKRILDKRIKSVSMEEIIQGSCEEYKNVKIYDALIATEDTVNEALYNIFKEEFSRISKMLTERKRKILKLHLSGKTYEDIGKEFNIGRNYVGKILRHSIEELKTLYERGQY